MALPVNTVKAIYKDTGIASYKGNPFIEALPPLMSIKQISSGLSGRINFRSQDVYLDGRTRVHIIASLLDDFFQPLGIHLQLEEKISILIRRGYVGRNIENGSLQAHLQNGYERLMKGDLTAFRFDNTSSTALSMSLIGCSGSGKSTAINRILGLYPQAIFHEGYNFVQLPYLKFDCPHNGSMKGLCLQFFRALDRVVHMDYEAKYSKSRQSIEMLLASMCQTANNHGIGVLIIDEIQHLSLQRSGGADIMLNFFVTLVNVIGLPVILVGTPKVRPILEVDFRSGRRSAGFGSLFWEPMKAPKPELDSKTGKLRKTEWIAFTDELWKYQWLQKRDPILSDDVRDTWYDLSQGIVDIVIKLFVLAQLRAVVTTLECITPKLLQKVHDDELKPVHSMLSALRSKDPKKIAQYSDLSLPDIDMKIIEFAASVNKLAESSPEQFGGNKQAQRLHHLLIEMDCEPEIVVPMVNHVLELHPNLTVRELMPILIDLYEARESEDKVVPEPSTISVKEDQWHTLTEDDLRFKYSQIEGANFYETLKKDNIVFDFDSLMFGAG